MKINFFRILEQDKEKKNRQKIGSVQKICTNETNQKSAFFSGQQKKTVHASAIFLPVKRTHELTNKQTKKKISTK